MTDRILSIRDRDGVPWNSAIEIWPGLGLHVKPEQWAEWDLGTQLAHVLSVGALWEAFATTQINGHVITMQALRDALSRLVAAADAMGVFAYRGRLKRADFAGLVASTDSARPLLQSPPSQSPPSQSTDRPVLDYLLKQRLNDIALLQDVVEQWESADGAHYLVPTELIDRIRARRREAGPE